MNIVRLLEFLFGDISSMHNTQLLSNIEPKLLLRTTTTTNNYIRTKKFELFNISKLYFNKNLATLDITGRTDLDINDKIKKDKNSPLEVLGTQMDIYYSCFTVNDKMVHDLYKKYWNVL